jgi:putative transcriptional regulator
LICYKIDVLKALEENGYSQTKLQREKLLSYTEINRIKCGEMVRLDTLDTICRLLQCDPTGILEEKE